MVMLLRTGLLRLSTRRIYTPPRSYCGSLKASFVLFNLFSSAPNHSASSSKAPMSVKEIVEVRASLAEACIHAYSYLPERN
jgi:hypothetical protein